MDKFFNWLSSGSIATTIFIIAFCAVVMSVILIYVVAFFQRRSISFWPPKIGEKPIKIKEDLNRRDAQGEAVSVTCEQLGIREIFPRRDHFNTKYPLKVTASSATDGSLFRIVARSLYLVMNKPEAFKQILQQGGCLELCFFDPEIDPGILKDVSELETFDTLSALSTFRKHLIKWLQEDQPPGCVEIRYHQVHLFDSYSYFVLNGEPLAAWDLSFGRDITDKTIFLLEPTKGFGANLHKRYNTIWEKATPKFKYNDQNISLDELPH